MDSHELRETFLRFFEEKGHRRTPSAPIVPPGDPTLLFNSAGMVPFKQYFMGQAKPPHPRLTSVQKCFRTTDIESVGDASHLTFFEMLGNFSIGDYFKAEAIPWAWEFLTEVLGLDRNRLFPAVYVDDDESFDLWVKVGVPEDRIYRYGEDQNYWFAGDVGPCGPDSEIHYDFGEQFGCGPDCEPAHDDCERFTEIWNLVFMSFYCDGEKREPLPTRNIDTGAGLERITSVLLFESDAWDKNRLVSVYDTDLFQPIIKRIEELSGKRYGHDTATDRAMRIVAEHSRAVAMLIGDERTPVIPSNEERGYVVRRMLRRAVYFAKQYLNPKEPIVTEVVDKVIEVMWPSYPELRSTGGDVLRTVRGEEERFWQNLIRGQRVLQERLMRLFEVMTKYLDEFEHRPWGLAEEPPLTQIYGASDLPEKVKLEAMRPVLDVLGEQPWKATPTQWAEANRLSRVLPGGLLFLLWDTYGIPPELAREVAEGHGFSADIAGFQREMETHRARSREVAVAEVGTAEDTAQVLREHDFGREPATNFVGYDTLEVQSNVIRLLLQGAAVDLAEAPSEVSLVLDRTVFYPEGGGQVGDRGEIAGPNGRFVVEDTQRVAGRLIVHRGRIIEGKIAKGDRVTARVDPQHREDTMRNHTATHLTHAALRQVLGTHVRQSGSLVAPDHMRFDFTHMEGVTPEQMSEVERLVNFKVRQNLAVDTRLTTFDKAMDEGVLAFFGEKYGEEVRVVEVNTVVPKFSAELCGGTHCHQTGEIGAFVITGESSIGAGMRRIEALTGRGAEEYIRTRLNEVDDIARRLASPREQLVAKVDALLAEQDALRKRIEKLERSLASAPAGEDIVSRAVDVDGVKVVAATVDAPSVDALRYRGDAVRKGLGSGVAVLASVIDDRPMFIAMVTKDVVERGPKAGEILKRVATVAGGSGGGRPEMAQGGGKDPSKVDEALAIVPDVVREMLGG